MSNGALGEIIQDCIRRILREYQLEWLLALDRYSFVAILGARQIGKDLALALYAVAKGLLEPGSAWNTFSASAKHASQWLDDCRLCYAFIRQATILRGCPLPALGEGLKNNVTRLELPGGSAIMSNASTVRSAVGLRGSVLFNECGVLGNAREMYEALYPIVEGARDNGRPAKMIMVSNASARGTWWHDWWTGSGSRGWHRITTTWTDAMRRRARKDGSRLLSAEWIAASEALKIERLGVGGYAQWYACQWRAVEDGYLPVAMLERQTYDTFVPPPGTPQVLGYDIGRVVDPSAWSRMLLPDSGEWAGMRMALDVEAAVGMAYNAQRERFRQIGDERQTLGSVIDSTGIGDEMGEVCAAEMPFPVTQFKFTAQSKQALFETLRSGFTGGRLWIPRSDTDLRMELESLTARYHVGGRVTMDIPRTRGCHGDRAVALALAEYGAVTANTSWFEGDWGMG